MTEIRYDVTDGVALITLDAPERRNALSVEMSRELIDAARTAEADDAVGAVVVTGGAHFCAGAVRSVLADTGRDPVEDEAYRNLETVYAAFTTIGSIGVPTVAAVRGAAVGAGLNLALATDLRIVSRTARLLPGFAQIGIHPGGGHFTLINRVAGREAAAALGLFGDEVDGDRAVALGLAWAAYDDGDVQDARAGRSPAGSRRTPRSPAGWSRASAARPRPAACRGTSPSSSSAHHRCGRCAASTAADARRTTNPAFRSSGAWNARMGRLAVPDREEHLCWRPTDLSSRCRGHASSSPAGSSPARPARCSPCRWSRWSRRAPAPTRWPAPSWPSAWCPWRSSRPSSADSSTATASGASPSRSSCGPASGRS